MGVRTSKLGALHCEVLTGSLHGIVLWFPKQRSLRADQAHLPSRKYCIYFVDPQAEDPQPCLRC